MFRLLTLRVFVASLKRAIAISDKLEPAAWGKLTVTLTVLAAASFWGYLDASQQSTDVSYSPVFSRSSGLSPNIAKIYRDSSNPAVESGASAECESPRGCSYLVANTANPISFEITEAPGISVLAHEFADYGEAYLYISLGHISELTSQLEVTYFTTDDTNTFIPEKAGARRGASYMSLSARQFVARLESLERAGVASTRKLAPASSFLGELAELSLWRNPFGTEGRVADAAQEAAVMSETGPVVVMAAMPVPPTPQPSPASLPLWALLAAFIFNSLSAVVSWIFTLISLKRGKTDQILKEAQLYKLQLEIAHLRKQLERDARETSLNPAIPWF